MPGRSCAQLVSVNDLEAFRHCPDAPWPLQELEAKLNELRAAHRTELAELVRVSNKKYNDLLAEKLNREDELTAEAALHQKDVEALTVQVKQLKVRV
jgi:hypothetical protein